jgi:hypothetical protein
MLWLLAVLGASTFCILIFPSYVVVHPVITDGCLDFSSGQRLSYSFSVRGVATWGKLCTAICLSLSRSLTVDWRSEPCVYASTSPVKNVVVCSLRSRWPLILGDLAKFNWNSDPISPVCSLIYGEICPRWIGFVLWLLSKVDCCLPNTRWLTCLNGLYTLPLGEVS